MVGKNGTLLVYLLSKSINCMLAKNSKKGKQTARLLKVSKSRKQISKVSWTKIDRNKFVFLPLLSKMGQVKKYGNYDLKLLY